MLQVSYIRENKEAVINGLKIRNISELDIVDEVIVLDEQRRKVQAELDNTLSESNKLSKEIGQLYKSGEAAKANELKSQTSALKDKEKVLNENLKEVQADLQEKLTQIPNIPHPTVPPGKSDEDNQVESQEGIIPNLTDDAKPHWELAATYDLIDFELGVKIAGAGFPVYKNQGARLQRALINYFLDKNMAAGYQEYFLPHVVNEASGFGTGQLPDKEGQMYHMEKDDLYMIPTGEVPLVNCFRNEILKESDLPIKATTHTPCFRREAGSYGKHVRGLNRLHQFDKVEIIQIAKPADSYAILDEMVSHVGSILKELGLPYRILRLCGGDIGFTSALTFDFEVYSTAQERWLEVSSISNCEAYQTNRLKLRYRDENKKTQLCHALNGSSLALPRILAALLENNQTSDGIKIPEALVPYTGFDIIK